MAKFFSDFNGLEMFFLICAIIGGFFVFFKLVIQFAGGDVSSDVGMDVDIGTHPDHVDPDVGFRLLSIHGLSAFFMMFGLVGLALYRQSQMGEIVSITGSVAAGMTAVWVIGKVFLGARRLQSSGTLKTSNALGCSGTVYLTIPQGKTGQVSINFHNHLREFDAIEKNGTELPTGTPVRVVQVNANILVVEMIK